jgi:hypothetical protein
MAVASRRQSARALPVIMEDEPWEAEQATQARHALPPGKQAPQTSAKLMEVLVRFVSLFGLGGEFALQGEMQLGNSEQSPATCAFE